MLDATSGEALRSWIATRTELDVFWADQPQEYEPRSYVLLAAGDIRRIGQDGVRYELDGSRPLGQQMVPTVVGQREFTVSVQVIAWDQDLDKTAERALATLEAALQLPSFQALLVEQNLGLIETLPLRQTDEVVDDRVQSRATMDIRFATSIRLTDADEGQGQIATADIETTLQGGRAGDIVLTEQVGET